MSCKPSLKVQELINNDWLGLEDTEWQNRLYFFGGYLLLQRQTKVKVHLFELMCDVLDQNLPAHIHWMRHNCNYVKLKFHDQNDQIMLLKDSWSVILILDQMHQRIHNNMPDEIELPSALDGREVARGLGKPEAALLRLHRLPLLEIHPLAQCRRSAAQQAAGARGRCQAPCRTGWVMDAA